MIDIVRFSGERFDLGFAKVHTLRDFHLVFVQSEEDLLKAVKHPDTDIIFHTELIFPKNNLLEIQSGLNQVILSQAKRLDIAVGFDFHLILMASDEHRAEFLARMMQNIELCRKYNVKMVVASLAEDKYQMRHTKDLLAFCRALGMTAKEAQNALAYSGKERSVRVL